MKKTQKVSRISKRKKASSFLNQPSYVILVSVLVFFVVGKIVYSSLENNVLGLDTYLAKGGDDSESEDSNSGSGSSGSSNSGSSGSGSSGSPAGDSSNTGSSGGSGSTSSNTSNSEPTQVQAKPTTRPVKTKTKDSETGVRTQAETTEEELRTEVRISEGERIRTRAKDGETRVDITSGGIKTRLEIRDDRVIIKAEQEDGTEVELEDDTMLKIDDRLGASGIKIATAGAQKFVVQRGVAGAITNFPISIDLATNAISVNTPSGAKILTILPDQAIQNLITANIVSRLGGQAIVDEVRNNNFSTIKDVVLLGERNNVPIYEINGISDQKLLGFIPVAIQKTVIVSAETGDVVSTQESATNRALDFLSF